MNQEYAEKYVILRDGLRQYIERCPRCNGNYSIVVDGLWETCKRCAWAQELIEETE